jgi:CelD/BcsL family acetyltransferase involved in cellulose biosynthesis
MVETLADSRPRAGALHFAGLPEDSPWPGLVAGEWPGRLPPATRVEDRQPAPFVDVASTTAEDWFKSRSSNFRGQVRRARRDLESRGAFARMASTPDEIARDVDALIRLHLARWSWRGGSAAMTPGVERMLREEAAVLVQAGTLRLAGVATAEETVAVQAIVAAGGEASYWLGGFDAEWAAAKPGIVALHTALEDSFAHGDVRFDLGGGDQEYKRRFTDSEQLLTWTTVLPRFARTPLDRLLMAPWRARSWLADVTRGRREQLARSSRERARRRLLGNSKDGGEGH